MNKIGKDANGKTMYLTDEELLAIKNGASIPGNNQQRAKIRKLIKKIK